MDPSFFAACDALSRSEDQGGDKTSTTKLEYLQLICVALKSPTLGSEGQPLTKRHLMAATTAIACASVSCVKTGPTFVVAAVQALIDRGGIEAQISLSGKASSQALQIFIAKMSNASQAIRCDAAMAVQSLAHRCSQAQLHYGTTEMASALAGLWKEKSDDASLASRTAHAICAAVVSLTSGYDVARHAFSGCVSLRRALMAITRFEEEECAVAAFKALSTLASAGPGYLDHVAPAMWQNEKGDKATRAWADTVAAGLQRRWRDAESGLWVLRCSCAVAVGCSPDTDANSDARHRVDLVAGLSLSSFLFTTLLALPRSEWMTTATPQHRADAAGLVCTFVVALLHVQPRKTLYSLLYAAAGAERGPPSLSEWAASLLTATLAAPRRAIELVRWLLAADAQHSSTLRAIAKKEGWSVAADPSLPLLQSTLASLDAVGIALCRSACASPKHVTTAVETLTSLMQNNRFAHQNSITPSFRDAFVELIRVLNGPTELEWAAALLADMCATTGEGQAVLTVPAVRSALVGIAATGVSCKAVQYWVARAVAQLAANNMQGKALLVDASVRDHVVLRIGTSTQHEPTRRWIVAAVCNVLCSNDVNAAAKVYATEAVCDMLIQTCLNAKDDDVRQSIARSMCAASRVERPYLDLFVTMAFHDALSLAGEMARNDETRSWLVSAIVALCRSQMAQWRFRVMPVLHNMERDCLASGPKQWIETALLGMHAPLLVQQTGKLDEAPRIIAFAPFQAQQEKGATSAVLNVACCLAEAFGVASLQVEFSTVLSATETVYPVRTDADLYHVDATNVLRVTIHPFEVPFSELRGALADNSFMSLGAGPRGDTRAAECRSRPLVLKRMHCFTRDEANAADVVAASRQLGKEMQLADHTRAHPALLCPVGVVRDEVSCSIGGTVKDVPVYVIFERCDMSLRQKLSRGTFLGTLEARRIGLKIAEAVEHLHACGLTHGHLHSRNVLLRGEAVLVDDAWGFNSVGRSAVDVAAPASSRVYLPPEADDYVATFGDADAATLTSPSGPTPFWDSWAFGFVCLEIYSALKETPMAVQAVADAAVLRPPSQRSIDGTLQDMLITEPWATIIKGSLQVTPGDRMPMKYAVDAFKNTA